MKNLTLVFLGISFFLSGCAEVVSRDSNPRILAMGDSLLAAHKTSDRSISSAVEKILGEPVIDRSTIGARIIYKLPITGSAGMNIPKQYRAGDWDWVILNGGGNDLWFGCGCIMCKRKIERLISADGQAGEIPKLVSKIRKTGARVIYVGYLRSPGVFSPVEHCANEGNELERRIAKLARRDKGVYFMSLATLVPKGDRSYHAVDMIHPSAKASRTIGARITKIIRP